MLGGTPVKKMMIHNDTMDATMVASDLQAGVTAYANGQKVTGTGKSFEFATYGVSQTNTPEYVPVLLNIIEITSLDYPIKSTIPLNSMKNIDFSVEQTIGAVLIDGNEYPITAKIENSILTFCCDKTVRLESFYGKDNYI
jgi:hypothetical protein